MKLLIYDEKEAYAKGLNTTQMLLRLSLEIVMSHQCLKFATAMMKTNATDRNDKTMSIESNSEPNIAESNDIAIGLDTAQGVKILQ